MSQLHPGYYKIEVILNKLLQNVQQIAHIDGVASTNERHLIHNLNSTLPDVRRKLKSYFDDGTITNKEKIKVHQILSSCMEKIVALAKSDEKIEYDEKMVIDQLRQSLVRLIHVIKKL